jgi:hypothetical protein
MIAVSSMMGGPLNVSTANPFKGEPPLSFSPAERAAMVKTLAANGIKPPDEKDLGRHLDRLIKEKGGEGFMVSSEDWAKLQPAFQQRVSAASGNRLSSTLMGKEVLVRLEQANPTSIINPPGTGAAFTPQRP